MMALGDSLTSDAEVTVGVNYLIRTPKGYVAVQCNSFYFRESKLGKSIKFKESLFYDIYMNEYCPDEVCEIAQIF